ncbi:Putative regulatory protein [Alloactinosynnema sp. L-07]|uniref:ArsR/SmtB family transcription factor n=1 Tax=Alloactinosynnema sp. L-07 TaxID=1653480 RepID=UPI00065EF9FF|nr:helix-turn-helix domain-containing protein [Alloactinosynnema sp. L-07]CRK61959.1 Putative regulatory protein [Alloactinosynnema sp. L-07]
MLRLRFDLDELARTTLSTSGVAATIEAVCSGALLTTRPPLAFDGWRRRFRTRVDDRMRPLLDLVPPASPAPDFLTVRTDDPADVVEHLSALSAAEIAFDLIEAGVRPSRFTRLLASGDREARATVGDALRRYHHAFADELPLVRAVISDDLAYRASVLAAQGIGGLLESLHPAMRWRSPVLEIDGGPDREASPGGRQVRLVPSVFMWRRPYVLIEPDGPCFITYPARGALRLGSAEPACGDPLADLLGRTRAAALRAINGGATTSELSERLAISLASASEHASVLRRARLITTSRQGRAVRHTLTPLGHNTLAGGAVQMIE